MDNVDIPRLTFTDLFVHAKGDSSKPHLKLVDHCVHAKVMWEGQARRHLTIVCKPKAMHIGNACIYLSLCAYKG